jgi:hypothetical protein
MEAVSGRFAGAWEDLKRAPYGYGYGRRLVDADGQVCQVWWGDRHAHPHAVFSGECSPDGAALLRAEFAAHRVTRADVCIDYAAPGSYDRLQELALGVARDRGIKVGTAGDHLLTKQGRTLYLGSSASHTRMRLYDKAAELRQQYQADLVRLAAIPAELARLEVQVRPASAEAKRAAATVEPMALMGSAAWSRELLRQVEGVALEPFQAGKVWRQSDDSRAYASLLAQYGGLLTRVCADLGSWACLGEQIGYDLAERAKAKR